MINFCPKCGNKLNGKHFCDACKTNLINYMEETLTSEAPNRQKNSEYLSALDALTSQTKDAIRRKQEENTAKRKEEELRRSGFDIQGGVLVKYTGPGGDVVVPEGVVVIGESAFEKRNVRSVDIPDNVRMIEAYAFRECEALVKVKLPYNLSCIGGWAFSGCSQLSSIQLPHKISRIGTGTFTNCSNLKSINLADVVHVGAHAFADCRQLESVDLSRADVIEAYAFYGAGLRTVNLPLARYLQDHSFGSCDSLTVVKLGISPKVGLGLNKLAFFNSNNIHTVYVKQTSTSKRFGYNRIDEVKSAFATFGPEAKFIVEEV